MMMQWRQRRRPVGGSSLQELLEPELECLSYGGDDVLRQSSSTLQDVACSGWHGRAAVPGRLGALLGDVRDVVQRVAVAAAREADVGHLVLVNDSTIVEVR